MEDSNPFKIHNKLLSDLITEYLDSSRKDERKRNFIKWKLAFRNINSSPRYQSSPILQDLYYLEDKELLGIGKYDILRELMCEIGHAGSRIKETEERIKAVRRDRGNMVMGMLFSRRNV
jgi:hypothetical protein